MSLHYYYDQLTDGERALVDDFMRDCLADATIPLANDDRAERVADALARWIIQSRSIVALSASHGNHRGSGVS